MQFFSRYKMYAAFLILIVGGIIFASVVTGERYPILLVNNHPVSARQFATNYRAASLYYDNVLKTYKIEGSELPRSLGREELELKVLNQLVEAVLVDLGVRKEVGKDVDELVAAKIEHYERDETLTRASEALYGLSFEEFRSEVLVPQAKKDILSGRLFLRGEVFENWVRGARANARIIIFSNRFRWDGENVVGNR